MLKNTKSGTSKTNYHWYAGLGRSKIVALVPKGFGCDSALWNVSYLSTKAHSLVCC